MPTQPLDVLVVGAGVIGLTTAYALHADGHRVRVLEAQSGPAKVTSQSNGGFLSPAYSVPFATPDLPKQAWQSLFKPESPMRFRPDGTFAQWRWLWALWRRCNAVHTSDARRRFVSLGTYSLDCLDELVTSTGIEFDFAKQGVLQLVRHATDQPRAERQAETFTHLGFPTRWLKRDELLAIEPGLARSKVDLAGALFVESEAMGDCERFCLELARWLGQRGVIFEFNQSMSGLWLDASGQRVQGIHTNKQSKISAQAVVVATGMSAPESLAKHFRLPIQPIKGYSLTVQVGDAEHAPRHALIDEASRLAVTRLGHRVRMAGVAELVGADLRVDPRRVAQLLASYEALYPQAGRADAVAWSGLRPTTPDGPPIVSKTPISGLWLNVGHGGYGWTLSCGSARLLADLVAGRSPMLPVEDFALSRYAHA
jgi:D-amino-acid dehydrogenase